MDIWNSLVQYIVSYIYCILLPRFSNHGIWNLKNTLCSVQDEYYKLYHRYCLLRKYASFHKIFAHQVVLVVLATYNSGLPTE